MTAIPSATVDALTGDLATWQQLRHRLPAKEQSAVLHSALRLRDQLKENESEDGLGTVLVAYGGGKDSSYTVTFVRAMQLCLSIMFGETFRLRVVTNRHAGMPQAVMENIDRAYAALGMLDDPRTELLVIDGERISPFAADLPVDPRVVARNRLDLLMAGHRTGANGRPTFCNACNLSMVNSFGLAAGKGDNSVDVIITGDSEEEQRDYRKWIGNLAARFGLLPASAERKGFRGFLRTVDNLAQAYFDNLYGDPAFLTPDRAVCTDVEPDLQFFSIYRDTAYDAGSHWQLLTEFLGFTFDDIAFSFSESDCGNPGLMAHLRGLKVEHVFGRSYDEGLDEYVSFAIGIMRNKQFPDQLVTAMQTRYDGPLGKERMRREMESYAHTSFGLEPHQLVCLVYSPFVAAGAGLRRFLAEQHPGEVDLEQQIHELLSGSATPELSSLTRARQFCEEVSGLELAQLRMLYRSTRRASGTKALEGSEIIDAVLDGDPHKDVIKTRHTVDGPVVQELLSGR
jgi:hypothetical protein